MWCSRPLCVNESRLSRGEIWDNTHHLSGPSYASYWDAGAGLAIVLGCGYWAASLLVSESSACSVLGAAGAASMVMEGLHQCQD